jgi:hypothetical protein
LSTLDALVKYRLSAIAGHASGVEEDLSVSSQGIDIMLVRSLMLLLVTAVLSAAMPVAQAGILLHLSASDLALNDGDPVAAWGSLSATGTAQPTFRTTGMNGNAAIQFDDTNDYLTGGAVSGARSIVAVAIDTGSRPLAGLISNDNDKLNIRRNGTTRVYRSEGQSGDNNDFYRHDTNVGPMDGVWVNGVVSGTYTAGVSHVVLANSDGAANFGTTFTVGRAAPDGNPAANRYWGGYVSEVYVFDQTLTADEIAGVSSILADRWGSPAIAATPEQIVAGQAVLGVPEPSTLLLAAMALLALVVCRFRR